MAYFSLIIFPCWLVARKAHVDAGAMLYPAVRPGPDHHHMAPRLFNHLMENNYESAPDVLGRRTAIFYKNTLRASNTPELRPEIVRRLNSHGFSF